MVMHIELILKLGKNIFYDYIGKNLKFSLGSFYSNIMLLFDSLDEKKGLLLIR